MSALSAFANIGKVPELRRRILFTVVLLAVYRIGVFVTIPGVDRTVMNAVIHKQGAGLFGLFNMFSGGAFGNLSIFALGIMPYVSASIILQLLTMVFKPLDDLRKEGEQGQRKINQYTRYGTIVLSLVQAFGIAMSLEAMNNGDLSDSAAVGDVVTHGGWAFRLMSMLTLTTGTAFMMWVGEQITERGIGNGISLLIFAGIVDGIPEGVASYFATNKGNIEPLKLAFVVAIILATVATIVFFERAQRRIPIYYARRTVGRRVYGGQTAHLPLRVNTSGTIPPIFASSLLLLPNTVMAFFANANLPPWMQWLPAAVGQLQHGRPLFMVLYGLLIVFFCFFYTSVVFNPEDTAENLRKYGGFMPGIRPGKRTAEYLDFVLTRLTVIGAAYIAIVCLLPEALIGFYNAPFYMGGTSVLIVVSVTMDTVTQIQSHLLAHQYEGLIKKSKLRGTRGR